MKNLHWIWLPILIIIFISIYITELGKPEFSNSEKSSNIINQIPENLILASEEIVTLMLNVSCKRTYGKIYLSLLKRLFLEPKKVL